MHLVSLRKSGVTRALQWITNNSGITTGKDYPYKARQGKCDRSKLKHRTASISGFRCVSTRSEVSLQNAVAMQPVCVGIHAVSFNFQHYTKGIYNGPCGTKLNHAVTIIGYGHEGKDKYWIVKNSWGDKWGEKGFIKMKKNIARKQEGLCGITINVVFPLKKRHMLSLLSVNLYSYIYGGVKLCIFIFFPALLVNLFVGSLCVIRLTMFGLKEILC
jgi:hypothetical protein